MSLLFLFICFVSFFVANAAIEEDPDPCPAEWEVPEALPESKIDVEKLPFPKPFEQINEAMVEEELARPIETADDQAQRVERLRFKRHSHSYSDSHW
ncbi:unnamed protein product [Cylicocyclus nassatus]|uniref:Uncharacterized protein n=1 Tax=Cylicocyclus nassatus TaxID=53992 RepID=A0AA36H775_CYLNA|nr:unnamed protein product [Cylicocyclus nassatus]